MKLQVRDIARFIKFHQDTAQLVSQKLASGEKLFEIEGKSRPMLVVYYASSTAYNCLAFYGEDECDPDSGKRYRGIKFGKQFGLTKMCVLNISEFLSQHESTVEKWWGIMSHEAFREVVKQAEARAGGYNPGHWQG